MIEAIIDAPWIEIDGAWRADYPNYIDVTGEEWHEIGGEQRKGGNYPPGLDLEPEFAWLTIKINVNDTSELSALDAQDKYHVYWDVSIGDDPGTRAAPYRDKESVPDANTWGLFRSKLARRGYSQSFIDTYVDKRELQWGEHDTKLRGGYLAPSELRLVNITQLAFFLEGQGWNVIDRRIQIRIVSGEAEYVLTQIYLQGCDFSDMGYPPLERDIRVGLNEQGFCT